MVNEVAAPEDEEVGMVTEVVVVDVVVEVLLLKTRRPMAEAQTTGRSRARLSLARLDITAIAEAVEAVRVVEVVAMVAKAKADEVATEMADMAAINTKTAAMATVTTSPDPEEVAVAAATLPKETASTSRGPPDVVVVAAVNLPSEHK